MKVITEKDALLARNALLKKGNKLGACAIYMLISDHAKEIDTLTVTKLRPMAEAREQGLKRVLACFFGCSNHFNIIEQNGDKYWSDGEDDYHSDNEFIGWLPIPIYKPELTGDGE